VLNAAEAAKTIVDGLKGAGINLVATLPDVNLADVLREVEEDRELIHVPLCREEEGIGICAGGYLVGKKCAAIMQNGGFFNSNNAIVSTLLQYQIPALLLIYYAGDIGESHFSTSGAMINRCCKRWEFATTSCAAPSGARADQARPGACGGCPAAGGAVVDQGSARPPTGAAIAVSQSCRRVGWSDWNANEAIRLLEGLGGGR
jgi:sulfopyruvate decarboxylase TPP-binding subunit